MRFISSQDELRAIYRKPHRDALRKELKRLDAHALKFLGKSPFVLIGTQDRDGNAETLTDASAHGQLWSHGLAGSAPAPVGVTIQVRGAGARVTRETPGRSA